jgi:phage FluMu protein Com
MKVLKDENEYRYDDFRELRCGVCKKSLWEAGPEIIRNSKIKCPQCGTVYTFEPTRWRVLSDNI